MGTQKEIGTRIIDDKHISCPFLKSNPFRQCHLVNDSKQDTSISKLILVSCFCILKLFLGMPKRQIVHLPKISYNYWWLCYSIQKADSCLGFDFARVFASGSDWKYVFFYQLNHVRWTKFPFSAQIFSAYENCNCKVHLFFSFLLFFCLATKVVINSQ